VSELVLSCSGSRDNGDFVKNVGEVILQFFFLFCGATVSLEFAGYVATNRVVLVFSGEQLELFQVSFGELGKESVVVT